MKISIDQHFFHIWKFPLNQFYILLLHFSFITSYSTWLVSSTEKENECSSLLTLPNHFFLSTGQQQLEVMNTTLIYCQLFWLVQSVKLLENRSLFTYPTDSEQLVLVWNNTKVIKKSERVKDKSFMGWKYSSVLQPASLDLDLRELDPDAKTGAVKTKEGNRAGNRRTGNESRTWTDNLTQTHR